MPDIVNSIENMPAAVEHPMAVTDSSAESGFTENDPIGPQEDESSGLLAGKFKNAEDLERAYKELEAKLGGANQTREETPQESLGPKVAAVETTEEATALLRDKGLDISTYTREYESSGQLSEQSLATLEKAGITRAMVNDYINGQRVLVESQVSQVKNSVGGEEAYTRLITWAAATMNDREKSAYDRVLATNDLDLITMAAQGLKARYDAAMGKDPQVVVSGRVPGGNDGQERFESRAQMVEAMRDPRYDKDPAYRARVERKIINSNI